MQVDNMKGKKSFIKVVNCLMFDENINAMECIDLIHDVKVSHKNVIDYIP